LLFFFFSNGRNNNQTTTTNTDRNLALRITKNKISGYRRNRNDTFIVNINFIK
jgi:hypothetical protein